jgi:CHAT domain-containing protein
VLALGNPDIGDPRFALPGAEREVRYIKTRFPGAETYVQKEATKARFVAESPLSDLVHVGAHADVDEIDPLYSVIYLASTERQPGLLEAHELYTLGLTHGPIVSLSACSTGLGRVARGDEVLGFSRSFLAAGARTLLVTLWPVDDAATARLMERFYDRVATGSSSALRAAQLELLRETGTKSPFFWAAFDLVGDPR